MKDLTKQQKTKAPHWNDLSESQKKLVTHKIVKAMSVGGRYRIVSGTDEWQRERGHVETKSEDEILTAADRGKLLDLARNAYRNNPQFVTILKQFDLHGIGVEGGKAVITFEDKEFSNAVKVEFAKWTRSAEFFDGMNLNNLLKVILKTLIIGGDLVVLFDDDLITDSGRVLVFEPDEIGTVSDDVLQKHYGKNAKQRNGRVLTPYSQFQGVIVSKSQRGQIMFAEDKSYFLKKNLNGNVMDELWLMPRNIFRIDQGRGISQSTSSLATLIDLQDYIGYEIAAAKKNSQTIAQVTQTTPSQTDVPSAFDQDVDLSGLSDEEIEKIVKEESDAQTQTVSLDRIKAAGVIYQVVPESYKMELLDTKHPNINSIEFTRWLTATSAAPYGLTNVYATLKCDTSYTAFRGEQIIAQPAFEEVQHELEQICDWILYRWSKWAIRKGIIEDRFVPEWLGNISWLWPKMKDVDVVKEQNAIALKLRNGTGTYREIYGSEWESKLEEVAKEIEYCRKHGIPHPAIITVSGAQVDMKNESNGDVSEN